MARGTLNMQRRHFEAIAATLAALKPDRGNIYAPRSVRVKGAAAFAQWTATVAAFTNLCASSNAQFRADKFRRACTVED